MPIVINRIRANGPCTFKTGGRTDPGQTAFWANGFGGEKFLGEQTDIPKKNPDKTIIHVNVSSN